jgi:hypothetical protein
MNASIQSIQSNRTSMSGGAAMAIGSIRSIFIFFFLCMNGWVFYYLSTMRSTCRHCANQRTLPIAITFLVILFLHIIVSVFHKVQFYTNIPFFILWAIFVALTLRLIYKMKEDRKCKCTKERSFSLLEQFMYINAFLIILAILIVAGISSVFASSPKFFSGGNTAIVS